MEITSEKTRSTKTTGTNHGGPILRKKKGTKNNISRSTQQQQPTINDGASQHRNRNTQTDTAASRNKQKEGRKHEEKL